MEVAKMVANAKIIYTKKNKVKNPNIWSQKWWKKLTLKILVKNYIQLRT